MGGRVGFGWVGFGWVCGWVLPNLLMKWGEGWELMLAGRQADRSKGLVSTTNCINGMGEGGS